MEVVENGSVKLFLGDCLETLKTLPDNSVDSIVCDPPYGLSFMGKKWDYDVPSQAIWEECFRVLKHGGHLLAFAGTRTQHRMAVRIEDAGFEIRDMIAWLYGSGFPKSLDVSKAIDKVAGAEREAVGTKMGGTPKTGLYEAGLGVNEGKYIPVTVPATEAAKQWQGWGTALKPALEPITVARKPLSEKTVAANVLRHGTGGINIDGCRVGDEVIKNAPPSYRGNTGEFVAQNKNFTKGKVEFNTGRFPANLIHDGSDEVVALFPHTAPSKAAARGGSNPNPMDWGNGRSDGNIVKGHNDNGGSASRFFYCAKASKKDRDEGLDGFVMQAPIHGRAEQTGNNKSLHVSGSNQPRANIHPTVKPTDLMRYLCRLVTPPNGTVLDPFMGSGSTGKAAVLEGFNFIGCELSEEYLAIAKARIEHAKASIKDNSIDMVQLDLYGKVA
jgi:DNA modification methylase